MDSGLNLNKVLNAVRKTAPIPSAVMKEVEAAKKQEKNVFGLKMHTQQWFDQKKHIFE